MNIHKKIENKYPKYNLDPMSVDIDLVAELIFINYLNPKHCWEIGTGKGDWAMWMNLHMEEKAHWNITENFDWSNTSNHNKKKYIPKDWPKNTNDIINHINNVFNQTNKKFYFNLYDKDINEIWHQVKSPVDLWRIDCDIENDEQAIKKMLEYSSDNVIFFVDDIANPSCLNRLCLMMDQVKQGNLELVFMGKGEGAWTKPGIINKFEMYDLFKEKQEYFKSWMSLDDKLLFGKKSEYIIVG